MRSIENVTERWEDLKDDFDDGRTMYAPWQNRSKRKKGRPGRKPRRQRHNDYGSDDETEASISSSVESASGITEEIKAKIHELEATTKNSKREQSEIEEKIEERRGEFNEYRGERVGTRGRKLAIYIAGLNGHTKRAIQQDFAARIRESDQKNAAEEDEDNFDPNMDIRNYDDLVRSLLVFCVSNPQSLPQHLNTFVTWASNGYPSNKLTDEEKRKEVRYLERKLGDLRVVIKHAFEACAKEMKNELHLQTFHQYPNVTEETTHMAPDTA
ncbi:hypothetical protein CC78DRAFT_575568 [Lojkania enalia]|uniref:Uncharacterized protein n=1 Tax=Lojkania enalia TaxID=147567 RepID=A0A9P4TPL1_9PLEO|nr:hypothetical protein CC78DRAFT_575568 [Didymosphaeria enalia]